MIDAEDSTTRAWEVVVNAEGQHSIWPVGKTLPAGWSLTGFRASKPACLAHIGETWPDIRPRSVQGEVSA